MSYDQTDAQAARLPTIKGDDQCTEFTQVAGGFDLVPIGISLPTLPVATDRRLSVLKNPKTKSQEGRKNKELEKNQVGEMAFPELASLSPSQVASEAILANRD